MPPSPVVIDLRGWKLKQPNVAEDARVPAANRRAKTAGGVFDDPQTVGFREREHRVHVGAEAEEMHRDDAHRSRRHAAIRGASRSR